MKYYSEQLEKFYDSEADLIEAEKSELKKKHLAEVSRKELAKKVEAADKRIELAYENYEKVKKEASDILTAAKKEAEELLDPAKKEIKDAEHERTSAIKDFNSKFGVYSITYTGEKAQKEYNRIVNQFSDIFKDAWEPFSWFW